MKVLKVYDGDTILVELGSEKEKVRLIGIDCPEVWEDEKFVRDMRNEKTHSATEMLELGQKAKEFTEAAFTPETKVYLDRGRQERDKYGRMLAYVVLFRPIWNWRLLNADLLRAGLARTMTIPPNDYYAEEFRKIEAEARAAGKGIWAK